MTGSTVYRDSSLSPRTADGSSMPFVTCAVVFLAGLWSHRRHDRPVLERSSGEVFTPAWAASYLAVVALWWLGLAVSAVLQFVLEQPKPEMHNPATGLAGIMVAGAFVFVVFRTARAIETHDPEPQGPLGQIGRFLRVAFGTTALAAFRFVRGEPYRQTTVYGDERTYRLFMR